MRKTLFAMITVIAIFAFTQENSASGQTTARGDEMVDAMSARSVFNSPIPDFTLTDQNGRRVRLYTDLIKGKVVVVSFFYTTCAFVCDVQGRNLAKLQTQLGDKLGRDVFLISVTRDPATDTPAQLNKWAKEHGVRRGWTLVTGDVNDISKLVARFLSDTIGPVESHSATIYVGNEAAGSWLVSSGLASPGVLMHLIDRVSEPKREP